MHVIIHRTPVPKNPWQSRIEFNFSIWDMNGIYILNFENFVKWTFLSSNAWAVSILIIQYRINFHSVEICTVIINCQNTAPRWQTWRNWKTFTRSRSCLRHSRRCVIPTRKKSTLQWRRGWASSKSWPWHAFVRAHVMCVCRYAFVW